MKSPWEWISTEGVIEWICTKPEQGLNETDWAIAWVLIGMLYAYRIKLLFDRQNRAEEIEDEAIRHMRMHEMTRIETESIKELIGESYNKRNQKKSWKRIVEENDRKKYIKKKETGDAWRLIDKISKGERRRKNIKDILIVTIRFMIIIGTAVLLIYLLYRLNI